MKIPTITVCGETIDLAPNEVLFTKGRISYATDIADIPGKQVKSVEGSKDVLVIYFTDDTHITIRAVRVKP